MPLASRAIALLILLLAFCGCDAGSEDAGSWCNAHEARRCHGHTHQLRWSSEEGSALQALSDVMSPDSAMWTSPQFVDWDGDGDLDVVVFPRASLEESEGERVRLFEQVVVPGNASTALLKNFVEREEIANPFHALNFSSLCGMAIHDWDDDHRLDVLTANSNGSVGYYKQMSDGTLALMTGAQNPFREISEPVAPDQECFIEVVAWDADGARRDLLLGEHHFSFASAESLPVLREASPLASAIGSLEGKRRYFVDWDGDGDLDLVALRGGHNIAYLEHLEDGTLAERYDAANPFVASFMDSHLSDWDTIEGLHFVDWDADGDLDILVRIVGFGRHRVAYLQRSADNILTERSGLHDPFRHVKVRGSHAARTKPVAVDWTGDGLLDVILVDCALELHYLKRSADGSVELSHSENVSQDTFDLEACSKGLWDSSAVELADFDGDGQLDFFLASSGQLRHFERADGAYRELRGTESPFTSLSIGESQSVRLVDWNRDGRKDLLSCSYLCNCKFFEQQLDASFLDRTGTPGSPFPLPYCSYLFVGDIWVLDWDGDSFLDIIVRTNGDGDHPYASPFRLYRRLPNGDISSAGKLPGFGREKVTNMINYQRSVASGALDWDGDGIRDFLFGMPDGTVKLLTPGFCVSAAPCSGHGSCHPVAGTCSCGTAYMGRDCSSCSAEHYTEALNAREERQCTACPTDALYGSCSGRGACRDDATARDGVFGSDAWHLAGDGSCSCSVPGFLGLDCEEGTCGAGLTEVAGHGKCVLDSMFCLLLLLSLLPLAWAVLAAVGAFGLPVRVTDISVEDSCVVVSTKGRHLLCPWAQTRVFLRDTGHPRLDKATQPCLAMVVDGTRFVLLHGSGEPLDDGIHASGGKLLVHRLDTLFRTGHLQVPAGVAILVGALMSWMINMHIGTPYSWLLGVFVAVTSLLIGEHVWRRCTASTPLEGRLKDFRGRLPKKSAGRECPRGAARAISAAQLCDFFSYFQAFIRDRNMYYVCANLVLPLTRPEQLSFAELVGPRQVTWFVSHYWGTCFRHFVDSLSKHAQSLARLTDWRDVTYWICTLSNNQWRVSEELGKHPEDSSFYLALLSPSCQGTAMVLDDEAAALSRSWCLFEILTTLNLTKTSSAGFAGLQLCTSSGVLNLGHARPDIAMNLANRLATLRLEDATASLVSDKRNIDARVQAMEGGFDAVNGFVRANIRAAILATRDAFDGDFQAVLGVLGCHSAGGESRERGQEEGEEGKEEEEEEQLLARGREACGAQAAVGPDLEQGLPASSLDP